MLGADSNVLVRFLAEDDPVQTPQAVRLLTAPENHPVFLSVVVLAETYWVLTKVEKFPHARVVAAFRSLLLSDNFRIDEADLVAAALDTAEVTGCEFADALIGLRAQRAGCTTTATFDTKAQRLETMTGVENS